MLVVIKLNSYCFNIHPAALFGAFLKRFEKQVGINYST